MSDDPERAEELKKRFEVQKKVDTDWKRKVELEKRKLAAQAADVKPAPPAPPSQKEKGAPAAPPAGPEPSPATKRGMDMGFVSLVQQLADQAALFLGLVPGYPEKHCDQALAAIEMLRALQEKTQGNLSAEESKALTGVLYELQMRYVQACGGGAA